MSLNAVLSNALSGLAVAQNALTVTSNNVANANTEGYSRQVAQQEALVIDGRGAGARAVATTRMVDELLSARLREQQARVGHSEILDSVHEQIQDRLFGAPGDADRGLGNLISRVATAAETLASRPRSDCPCPRRSSGRRRIWPAASRPPGPRCRASGASSTPGSRAPSPTSTAISPSSPSSTRRSAAAGAGPELLDRRDGLLASLAEKLEIAVAFRDDGSATVYTRAGQPLLDVTLRQLVYEPAATVGPDTSFGAIRVVPRRRHRSGHRLARGGRHGQPSW